VGALMLRSFQILAVTLAVSAAAFCADTKDAKTPSNPVDVKLSLDKTEPPIPVNFAFSVQLPRYCISPGLETQTPFTRLDTTPPPETCPAGRENVGPNIDVLLAAFAKDTAFVAQKGDATHLLFFCATKTCDAANIGLETDRVNKAIPGLVNPSPRYYEDQPVPSAVA